MGTGFKCQRDVEVDAESNVNANQSIHVFFFFFFLRFFGALARCSVDRRTGMIVHMCDAERVWTSEARVSRIKGLFVVCSGFCVSNKFGSLVFRTCWRCMLVSSYGRPYSTCAVCVPEVWQQGALFAWHTCVSLMFFFQSLIMRAVPTHDV